MKWEFISHPLTDKPELRKKQIERICKRIYKEENILPISPIHAFSFIEEETPELREAILKWCKLAILDVSIHNMHKYEGADVRVYNYNGKLSDGQAEEYKYCYKNKILMEFEKVTE